MSILRAVNINSNKSLADRVHLANGFFTRLKGLLFTNSLPPGHGLLLMPCASIHSFGMVYAIDAIFLDKHNTVVGLLHSFEPGKISRLYMNAHSCLELPAGTIHSTQTNIGDQLSLEVV